jgi:phosphatidylethanolamine-binding protein (PEBP) family uncharacterized protein
MLLALTSPEFAQGAAIPVRCTCESADRTPALVIGAMKGHLLETATLVGTDEKAKRH